MVVDRAGVPQLADATAGDDDPAPEIRGVLEAREGSTLLLRMPVQAGNDPMTASASIAQIVRVPTSEVLSLERQDFSVGRTSLLVAGAAALGTFIVVEIIDASRKSDGIDNPDPDVLFNLIRIPIG